MFRLGLVIFYYQENNKIKDYNEIDLYISADGRAALVM